MKQWSAPKVDKLDVSATCYGNEIKVVADAEVKIGQYTFYSFS